MNEDVARDRAGGDPIDAEDRDRFNTLLAAAQRDKPRDALVLALSPIGSEQRVNYGELEDALLRLAVALEGAR